MQEIVPDHTIIDVKKDHIVNKVYVTNKAKDINNGDTNMSIFNIYLNLVLKIAGLIWILTTIYYMYLIASIDFASFLYHKNEQGKEFSYFTASQFANYEYHGKQQLFKRIISKMTKIIEMTENMDEKELIGSLTTNKRNFLLHGPPGTGKTQFIKVLVKRLNENLCKKYNTNKDLVRAYFITPSMLENKFKGETERKIKALFDEARDDKDWKATFIFLDEIDAFFGHRMSTLSEHQTKSKTEFLNLLSGINDDLKKNIFVMGATNRPDQIDPAFVRRMGEAISFKFPDREELIHMLYNITNSWEKTGNYEECIEFVADTLHNKYGQSVVTDLCSEVVFMYGKKHKNLYQKLREYTEAYVNNSAGYNENNGNNFEHIYK
jgi:MoxR-like ATPase